MQTLKKATHPSAPARLLALLREPPLFMWCVMVMCVPFYVFESGLPQPGDFLILIVAPLALYGWDKRLPREHVRTMQALLWFTVWVAIVNYAWAFMLDRWGLHGKSTFVLFPIYYFYNAVVCLVVLVMFRRYGEMFLQWTINAVLAAVAIQVVYSFINPNQDALRESVFFNKPNQLGYYALLAASVIALCARRVKLSMLRASLGMSACIYLGLLSASRAAAGGIVIIFIVTFVTNPKMLMAIIPIVVIAAMIGGPIERAFEVTEHRVSVDQFPEYTFLEERGYVRIRENLEYLPLGAGEGGTDRFRESKIGTHEIHSSFGTIVFSYGIVGSVLFVVFVLRVLRSARLRQALILAPIFAWSVSHQGLRESMLWILLALFMIVKRGDEAPARAGPATSGVRSPA